MVQHIKVILLNEIIQHHLSNANEKIAYELIKYQIVIKKNKKTIVNFHKKKFSEHFQKVINRFQTLYILLSLQLNCTAMYVL